MKTPDTASYEQPNMIAAWTALFRAAVMYGAYVYNIRLAEKINSKLAIGTGMISRGEVALIIASTGLQAGLLMQEYFTTVVIMVILTTLITPPLLKYFFK